MRISDRSLLIGLCLAVCCGGQALAFDTREQPEGKAAPVESFKSVSDALKAGVRGLSSGDKPGAVRALQFAATKGNIAAQWKLARMYADGDGVAQDDYKAFQYFSEIANSNADETRGTMNASVVAKAFVQLGSYFLEGIPGSPIKSNPGKAQEMFHYAASYFGDPDAQYNVGRMYLDGANGPKDPRQAARWFNLAAEKGHPYAQAVLGQMLFNGQAGMPRQGPLGLSWMLLARQSCDPAKDAWIIEMVRKAEAIADEDERKLAGIYAKRFSKGQSTVVLQVAPVQ